jgi:hypothetical protein
VGELLQIVSPPAPDRLWLEAGDLDHLATNTPVIQAATVARTVARQGAVLFCRSRLPASLVVQSLDLKRVKTWHG